VGLAQTDKVAWYRNLGNGSFSTARVIATNSALWGVFAADLDGDGDMDVVTANRDNTVAWYRNDEGSFISSFNISTDAMSVVSVAAADLDDDGDMDVVSASYSDDKIAAIAWHRNDGSAGFTQFTITTDVRRAYYVYAADLDGDGSMEVISASLIDGKVAYYQMKTIV
jgi:hypothetical protein